MNISITLSLKPGRIVVILNGRFAGRKGIIVKNYDEGTKVYSWCLISNFIGKKVPTLSCSWN